MKPQKILWVLLVCSVPVLCSVDPLLSQESITDTTAEAREDAGTARYWPLLPPYQDVDLAANFNKLKDASNVGFFNVRDTIAWITSSAVWFLLSTVFWDGQADNTQDVISSILSPGTRVDPGGTGSLLSSLLVNPANFFNEVNFVKLWNFLADRDISIRNIFLNMGWALCTELIWILPTFIGKLPDSSTQVVQEIPTRADTDQIDRIIGLPETIAESKPNEVWNRIFSPQGVMTQTLIGAVVLTGRYLYWTIMSNLPDLPASTILRKRSIQEKSSLQREGDEFLESVNSKVEALITSLEKKEMHSFDTV